jgi:hypothetical protein
MNPNTNDRTNVTDIRKKCSDGYMAQHKRKGAGALDGIMNCTGYIKI